MQKKTKKAQKICVYAKKAVHLQAETCVHIYNYQYLI